MGLLRSNPGTCPEDESSGVGSPPRKADEVDGKPPPDAPSFSLSFTDSCCGDCEDVAF